MPLPRSNCFFIFVQFSGKFGKLVGWFPPHLEWPLASPRLGNNGSATAMERESIGLRYTSSVHTQWSR